MITVLVYWLSLCYGDSPSVLFFGTTMIDIMLIIFLYDYFTSK